MEFHKRIRLNVCKSWSCPNLGVADSKDYAFPVFRLGYAALGCDKCGSLPPLFDEEECDVWFRQLFAQMPPDREEGCPHCHNMLKDCRRYGSTQAGTQRWQCGGCGKVFTGGVVPFASNEERDTFLKQLSLGCYSGDTVQLRFLSRAASWCEQQLSVAAETVKRVATMTFTLPFQGEKSNQRLYVVLSADAESGHILQLTTNYSAWAVGDSLRYQFTPNRLADEKPMISLVDRVRAQEAAFMRRSQFDEISYGDAKLKSNDRGSIVRPVVAIHGHFQKLKQRYSAIQDHYLAHECVLRGGAITAWATEVRAAKTQLWFVVEDKSISSSVVGTFRYEGTWHIGWWDNL